MSSGSGASNMGFGGPALYSNANNALVNNTASTYSGGMSSNETQLQYGMNGVKSAVAAANSDASKISGSLAGGGRRRRRGRSGRSHRRKSKCCQCGKWFSFGGGSRRSRRRSRRRRHRRRSVARFMARARSMARARGMAGGHSQYQNNQPLSWNYSLGGKLSASESALANPPPYHRFSNCVDNYNHYTNTGFPSKGH